MLALLGPNGAGKTTTVETLEGYRRPSAGRCGCSASTRSPTAARWSPRIGVMLQRGGVYPGHARPRRPAPVRRLLRRPRAARGAARTGRARLGGPHAVAPACRAASSSGCRWRWPWSAGPTVAFLDEPTAGIDPQARLLVREVIRQLRDDGACVLLTTHELEEAERLADRVVIIDRGRVVAEGTPGRAHDDGGRRRDPVRRPGRARHGRSGRPPGRGGRRGATGRVPRRRAGVARQRGRPHRLAGRAPAAPGRPAGRPPDARGRLPASHRHHGPSAEADRQPRRLGGRAGR